MPEIKIDFNKTVRKMKPMHGMNCGSLTQNLNCDARQLFKEAGIPITRLHDCEYPFGAGQYVDVPCIFKNFDADENDPASYNFGLTDLYLKAIDECGTKIMYRLGSSIEHTAVKQNIYPPKDFLKWAKICEHIIMHYNEGWADGFHFGIEYWEIWTEPNHNLDEKPLMWMGHMPEFAEFYDISATYLKERFPDLKIGGPAFSSPATPPVHEFFDILKKSGKHPPLDFFSWHGYVDSIEKAVVRAQQAREILEEYGYSDSESIYDEWNYVSSWNDMLGATAFIHSYKGMAFNAAMMARMQYENCDMLNFYAATAHFMGLWNSLFERDPNANSSNGGKKLLRATKQYYPFIVFNKVFELKDQSELICDDERIYGVAASNGEKSAFMISSFAPVDEELEEKEIHISLKGANGKKITVYVTDKERDNKKTVSFSSPEFDLPIAPYSMIFVTVE